MMLIIEEKEGGEELTTTVGVDSRGGRGWRSELATNREKEGVTTSGGGEGEVSSRAREGKGLVVVVVAATGIVTAAAGTTLNS